MVEKNDKIYTFMGENLLELEFIEYIDDLRLSAKDDDCTYTVYKKDCYLSKDDAINGMIDYLKTLKNFETS